MAARLKAVVPFYTMSPSERRLLLEMLATEQSGETATFVGEDGRDRVASSLCDLQMARWISCDYVTLTGYGQSIAETLVLRVCEDELLAA